MALTTKQKAFIQKNLDNLSVDKIADQINCSVGEVNEFIASTFSKKVYPKWFYLIPIMIPIVFFFVIEIGLRIFDYGKDYSTFITISEDFEDKWFINPDLPFKYFSNVASPPSVSPDAFDKVKKPNAYRVFVLGGSSTAGWPYNSNASFPREVKRRLQLTFPQKEIEVINLGISAVNSYTIKDIVPDVIEQKPDLVLIYAGHNEFYGALGVGSSESVGNSTFIISSVISLRDYKTVQLIQNGISYFYGLFAKESSLAEGENETLMARMVGEGLIPFDSDLFNQGIDQFESNFNEILSQLKGKRIPVIIGTLTSNLKIKPFVSVEDKNQRSAEEIYAEAESFYKTENFKIARELFIKAKDLDALRFRAPEKINQVITNLSNKYNCSLVKIDSLFFDLTSDGITGYNLMVDHLHPTSIGYRKIGAEYFKTILQKNLIDEEKLSNSLSVIDSLSNIEYPFTQLDSTIADIRIRLLIGAYPFVPKGTANYLIKNFTKSSIVDSIASDVISRKLTWKQAHVKLADIYYMKNDLVNFQKEIKTIIADRPYNEEILGYVSEKLINKKRYNESLPYLVKLYDLRKDLVSSKWLGSIAIEAKDIEKSIKYLEIASTLDSTDAQILYNLSGAYYNKGYIFKSLKTLEKCLKIKPDYPQAQQFYTALKNSIIKK